MSQSKRSLLSIAGCTVYQLAYLPTFDFQSSLSNPIHNITHDSCILISDLGRFALSEFDFNVTFAMPDSSLLPRPLPINSMLVPDYSTIVTRFRVNPVEDIGGTLKIGLTSTNPSVLVSVNISQTLCPDVRVCCGSVVECLTQEQEVLHFKPISDVKLTCQDNIVPVKYPGSSEFIPT